ncbi:MAG: hypothetical protein SFX72_22995 [Isosphaeraceae bacterium]|nr:hypothetical protein [Isosphaeraceae bacterium]
MSLTLDDLLADSIDSQLISYSFESREIRFQLFNARLGTLFTIEARTDTVYGRSVPSDDRALCRMVVGDVARALSVRDGVFQAPSDPAAAREQTLRGLHLAHGRRPEDARWMITLVGDYILLCFLVRDLSEIRWTTE